MLLWGLKEGANRLKTPKTSPPAREGRGWPGLRALLRIWIRFPKRFCREQAGISWRSVVGREGSTPQSGFQLGRTFPLLPEVELPGLSGQPPGLKPTFCLFNG